MTLQLQHTPAHIMKRMTENGKKHSERIKWNTFVQKHIIMDDPRSQEEQMRDDMARDRSPVWFALIVLFCVLCYAVAAAFIVW